MSRLSKNTPSGGQGTATLSDRNASLRGFIFSSLVAVSLALTALTGTARAGDPSEEYYEPLNNASTLATSVGQLANGVNSFTLPAFFCKPPDSPQKAESERTLSDWGRQQRRLDRQAQRLSQLAVSVILFSTYSSDYESQVQLVRQTLIKLANIRSVLKANRTALQAVPERDCSKADSAAAHGSLVTAPGAVLDMSNEDALIKEWLTAAQTVKGDVDKFRSLPRYCKPPQRPNKQEAEDKLQALERLVHYFDSRIRTFNPMNSDDAISNLPTMIREMKDTLSQKRVILNRAREVDCGPKQSSVGMSNNQELGYALMDAIQNNPFKRDQGVAPAFYSGYETDVLYDAQDANRQVTRNILEARRRDQRRQDYDLPNTYGVNSSPIETQTMTNGVPTSEVGEATNASNSPATWEHISYDELVPPAENQMSPVTLDTRGLELNVPSGQAAEERVPTTASVDSPIALGTHATSKLGLTVNRVDQAQELQEYQY